MKKMVLFLFLVLTQRAIGQIGISAEKNKRYQKIGRELLGKVIQADMYDEAKKSKVGIVDGGAFINLEGKIKSYWVSIAYSVFKGDTIIVMFGVDVTTHRTTTSEATIERCAYTEGALTYYPPDLSYLLPIYRTFTSEQIIDRFDQMLAVARKGF